MFWNVRPMPDWATFHAKTDFAPWPLARGPFVGRDFAPGTDLSLWKNHPYPISFFVYRSEKDFLGGYDHGRRAGVVHVAAHRRKVGSLGVTTDIHFTDDKGLRLAALLGVETHAFPAGSQA